jgi:hypothetical protein
MTTSNRFNPLASARVSLAGAEAVAGWLGTLIEVQWTDQELKEVAALVHALPEGATLLDLVERAKSASLEQIVAAIRSHLAREGGGIN